MQLFENINVKLGKRVGGKTKGSKCQCNNLARRGGERVTVLHALLQGFTTRGKF
jgi:hypothetical protein